MRRRITNAKAVELAEKGLASYEDGSKPKILASEEDAIKQPIQDLIEKIGLDIVDSNAEILMACKAITENMNQQNELPEPFDTKKLDLINDKVITILQIISKPKEWDFEIERDIMGDIESVNAKQVIH